MKAAWTGCGGTDMEILKKRARERIKINTRTAGRRAHGFIFMNETVIAIDRLRILDTIVSAEIRAGELVAVLGPNRSGKTTFAEILRGAIRDIEGAVRRAIDLRDIAYSAYSADGGLFHYADFYYQQRYNTFDAADVDTVRQYLRYDAADDYRRDLFAAVLPPSLLETKLIELSSGETRKALLLKNLFREAGVYILDNPFSGLDEASSALFLAVLRRITRRYRKTVILLLADPPAGVAFDRIIRLNGPEERKAEADVPPVEPPAFLVTPPVDFEVFFDIEKEVLAIGKRILVRDLSWRIRRGEKWLLTGANGSGKSTLLSLLNADNPVAYRCDFRLFDRKRGTGESIWDIKARIGFISSDMQLYFKGSSSVQDIILSGLSDTMVLNRRITDTETARYQTLVGTLELTDLQNAPFGRLSSGEKKTVMIARALVKNPPVLILDEPFQDLDAGRFRFLHSFLAQCADENRTVIQTAHHDAERLPGVNRTARIENETLTFPAG